MRDTIIISSCTIIILCLTVLSMTFSPIRSNTTNFLISLCIVVTLFGTIKGLIDKREVSE
jgi:hypothetical protein